MSLFDLPRWFYKWVLGLIFNRPAQFLAMRYYDVRNFFDKRKEKKEKAKKDRKARVYAERSSSKTRRRRRRT